MRWDLRPRMLVRGAKTTASRYGVQAAIVGTGAILALNAANRPASPTLLPVTERVVAAVPAPIVQATGVVTTDSVEAPNVASTASLEAAAKTKAPPKLDNGKDHHMIDNWVDRLSSGNGFEKSLERMSKYTKMINAKLDAKQMPRDLIYLAMIESNFNPKARSPVKAVGLWQFMSPTARQFGLKVGKKVDERTNPSRSTDAALAYLSKLHDRFGSWYLAAAAYNSGEGTVSRALKRVTGQSKGTDDDFFRIAPKLPKETRDYVPKLIAAARIGNNPEKYFGD